MFERSKYAIGPVHAWSAVLSIFLVAGGARVDAQQKSGWGGGSGTNPPARTSPEIAPDLLAPTISQPVTGLFGGGPEVIGPWTIFQSPASAVLIAGGGDIWSWLNVANAPVTIDEAFTGFSLIDDGFANGEQGTTVEMTFSPAILNGAGTDLVLFDGRFSENSYAVSSDFDGFTVELDLPFSDFQDTGVDRWYFYGASPGASFKANVMATPIDLSDLGVPGGDTVSVMRVIITSFEGDLLGLGSTGACVALDFASEDDFATPLVNGQHIDTEFGTLVSLTSSGPNAGLGIFDSTPGGPNATSQDPDLLVGTGNVLILQTENLPPDGSDVFPRPNDDEDGGTIHFAFPTLVSAASLRLIDIDASDGAATVVLTDHADRTRTYTVQSNWTGDLLLAQPGQGVLDLTTLAVQPGFAATVATAAESPGFDPAGILRIDVHMDGSGAIDDLVWCPTGLGAATASERSSGTHSVRLTSLSLPVLGSTWDAELDCSAIGSGLATLDVRRFPAAGRPTLLGDLLISGPLVHRSSGLFAATARTFGWSIPNDLALCGLDFHAQGLCMGISPVRPKTQRLRGALSNAIDLVLGF